MPIRNPVTYFELPVTQMHRALRFYEAVFLVSLEPETIDGNQMALSMTVLCWTSG